MAATSPARPLPDLPHGDRSVVPAQHAAERVLFVTRKIVAANGQNKLSRKLAVADIGPNSLGGFKPM
jgi:hypothetical protein